MKGFFTPRRAMLLALVAIAVSGLLGGYSGKTFKMPNPNYYLP